MRMTFVGLALWALVSTACGGDDRFDCYVYDRIFDAPAGYGYYYTASSADDAETKCEQEWHDCDCS